MFSRLARSVSGKTTQVQSCRNLRAYWERGYLKDMYHRRQLIGADAPLARSAYPNWNRESELYAFSHRIGAPELDADRLEQALSGPVDDQTVQEDNLHAKLVSEGSSRLSKLTKSFLRQNLPNAPEELIEAVESELNSDEVLEQLGVGLGLNHLSEDVPSAFRALLAVLAEDRAAEVVLNFVAPNVLDVDFAGIFPVKDPFTIVEAILKKDGASEVEPRILRSSGVFSAEALYVVGIYSDKKLIGQSAGETAEIARDMASRASLLNLWNITHERVFQFGEIDLSKSKNTSLVEMTGGKRFTLENFEDQHELNVHEQVLQYRNVVDAAVGKSYTKRLRHKFSRGSLAKRSFKYLVKPKPYTVA